MTEYDVRYERWQSQREKQFEELHDRFVGIIGMLTTESKYRALIIIFNRNFKKLYERPLSMSAVLTLRSYFVGLLDIYNKQFGVNSVIPSHEFVEKYMDRLYFYYESLKNIAKRMEVSGMKPPLTLIRNRRMDSYLATALSPPIPPPPPPPPILMRSTKTTKKPPPLLATPPPPRSMKMMNKRGRKKRTDKVTVSNDDDDVPGTLIMWEPEMTETSRYNVDKTLMDENDDERKTGAIMLESIVE